MDVLATTPSVSGKDKTGKSWRSRIVRQADAAPTTLIPHPENWRRHPKNQQAALAGTLAELGWIQNIIVNERSGRIIDGHARVELALARGEASVPVVYVDLDDAEERLALATLDPLAALAETDQGALDALLAQVSSKDEGLLALLAGLRTPELPVGLTDPDDVPPVPAEPVTQPGDLWLLGEHRLLCGDSTKAEDVARLLGGERGAMLWADPPYGIDYIPNYGNSNRAYKNDRITGDGSIDGSWLPLFAAPRTYLCTRWDVYPAWVVMLTGVRNVIVWDKGQGAAGNLKSYAPRHEFIVFAAEESGDLFSAGRQDNVWEVPGFAQFTARRAEDVWGEHPTQKPTALVERALTDSSRAGAVILDPFLGSGTTIIACERLSRRCYAMEIEPRYVDVSVRRWEQFTGREATRG